MPFAIYNVIRTQEHDNLKDSKMLIATNLFMVVAIRWE